MPKPLISLIVKLLRETADKIETGSCEISAEQQTSIISMFAHEPLTKTEACKLIHKERSRFDDLVRAGKIPRGRPRPNHKELYWYKDELMLLMDID